jgi:hypothetical protein
VLAEQLADVPRVVARAVDLGGARRDAPLHDLADAGDELAVLLGNLVDAFGRNAHVTTVHGSTRQLVTTPFST